MSNMFVLVFLILLVLGSIVFVTFRKQIFAPSTEGGQRGIVCLLVLSISFNAYVLGKHVISNSFVVGGGQSWPSPDGIWRASASSLRPHLSSEPTSYVFTLESRDGRLLRSLRMNGDKSADPTYFRNLPQIIQWSADSKEVTFDIPGTQIRMQLLPNEAFEGNEGKGKGQRGQ